MEVQAHEPRAPRAGHLARPPLVCTACQKPIAGEPVTFEGEGYAPQHFHPRHAPSRVVFRDDAEQLPSSFPKTEIGLLTADEFLALRNPDEKHHETESYDFDLDDLNREYATYVGSVGSGSERLQVDRLPQSGALRIQRAEDKKVVAVIQDGIAYFDRPAFKSKIPRHLYPPNERTSTDLGIRDYRQVKYLSELLEKIEPLAGLNRERYPVVLRHIHVKGEGYTIRAAAEPVKNKGITLGVLNRDCVVVARASNEWGATLLSVAREYRGKGLGKILGEVWYEHNPRFTSGGFTPAGERNALALWRDRVHEFSARGWYTALVREGRLTKARVKEILADAGPPARREREEPPAPRAVEPTGELLVYSDGEAAVVVYDRAFLEEPDERFIHGYALLRDASRVGVFVYRIDYDRPFAELTTRAALQLARDNHEDLYDGDRGYHDLLELAGVPGVERRGDEVHVAEDLLPLKALASKERRMRKKVDPYDEAYHQLLEMAESKWD